jgi:hypothetical protein
LKLRRYEEEGAREGATVVSEEEGAEGSEEGAEGR